MAEVETRTAKHVDYLLKLLSDAWSDLPRVEQVIDGWDLVEQIDYVEEWGAKESLADVLRAYQARGEMTENQVAHLRALERLMERNRPILERLRAS